MRRSAKSALNSGLAVAVALALAGCGGNETEANVSAAGETDSNFMLEQLGNDASALEAAGAAAPMAPADEQDPDSDDSGTDVPANNGDQPVLGETSGGDTGGNTVQGNSL